MDWQDLVREAWRLRPQGKMPGKDPKERSQDEAPGREEKYVSIFSAIELGS